MDTMSAFALGKANRGNELKVFDWSKAAKLIKESGCKEARAGLTGDWEWTGGQIFSDGEPVKKEDAHVYLVSIWATPELEIDGNRQDCYLMKSQTPDGSWDRDTFWPKEALDILGITIDSIFEVVEDNKLIEFKKE